MEKKKPKGSSPSSLNLPVIFVLGSCTKKGKKYPQKSLELIGVKAGTVHLHVVLDALSNIHRPSMRFCRKAGYAVYSLGIKGSSHSQAYWTQASKSLDEVFEEVMLELRKQLPLGSN